MRGRKYSRAVDALSRSSSNWRMFSRVGARRKRSSSTESSPARLSRMIWPIGIAYTASKKGSTSAQAARREIVVRRMPRRRSASWEGSVGPPRCGADASPCAGAVIRFLMPEISDLDSELEVEERVRALRPHHENRKREEAERGDSARGGDPRREGPGVGRSPDEERCQHEHRHVKARVHHPRGRI